MKLFCEHGKIEPLDWSSGSKIYMIFQQISVKKPPESIEPPRLPGDMCAI